MTNAVIYCRSSKDRAEMGLAAQRTELKGYAKANGLTIVEEFSDMEISGSLDETSRPGLRNLLTALRYDARSWKVILALDTSRLARDPMLALYLTREAEKHGVTIRYAKMPVDGNSAFGETMLAVVRAFDRLHARLSAEKGRAGQTSNLAKGYRAGGSAPSGYKLKHEETGAMRGGLAVKKSTLVIDRPIAEKIKIFLKARAGGVGRIESSKRAKLDKAVASLIAIERNALTYAGFTVWNQRQKVKPTREDPRKTMLWRARSEWIISDKPTHEAVITRAEAEKVLALHEVKKKRVQVREPNKFILSGLLFTPSGIQWHGDAYDKCYRAGAKGRRINAPYVEGEILYRVAADFTDRAFLKRTITEARRMAAEIEADPLTLDKDIKRLEKQRDNLLAVAGESGNSTLLAKIEETEKAIEKMRDDKAAWNERKALKERLLALNAEDMRRVLAATALKLRGDDPLVLEMIGYKDKEKVDPEALRQILTTLVERVELEPATQNFAIHYRLPLTGVKLASPRGFEPRLPP